jgi:hypothetical protein
LEEIRKTMFHRGLVCVNDFSQTLIAGVVQQFGGWTATFAARMLVMEGRIHFVVLKQRSRTVMLRRCGPWHRMVTLYKIGA